LITKLKLEHSKNIENLYTIDESCPRFIVIQITVKKNVVWYKLPYEYEIIMNENIQIVKIDKIILMDEVFGYYVRAII